MKDTKEFQLHELLRKKNIRAIALDLDCTTLLSDGTLGARTRHALEASIAAGIHVIVVSGRPRCSLPLDVIAIPGITYFVTSNGAAVNRRIGDGMAREDLTPIWSWQLSQESALQLLELTLPLYQQEQLTYEAFVGGVAYAPEDYVNHPTRYGTPEFAVPYVQSTRLPVADFPAFIRAHACELDSFDMIVPDRDGYAYLREQIAGAVSDIYMTSSMDRMLEISNRNAGKASGLDYVLRLLDLQPDNAIAFGDGENDADMLQYAGIGVAVANAMELCLNSADYVTMSNDDYGVAEVVEYLLQTQ